MGTTLADSSGQPGHGRGRLGADAISPDAPFVGRALCMLVQLKSSGGCNISSSECIKVSPELDGASEFGSG